ncbi:uncharacterized protein [Nicotiana sylvestris]|uniref:uncharacterized protein n=1 Tax=Nicotiana sylvestris TaxID=4096 RepID=UPI00388C7B97
MIKIVAATMGDVEPVPNFRGWVDAILKAVPMEARTWKSISNLHGWKVKTHGFAIRGMTAEVAIALRASSGTPLYLERTQATLSKRKNVEEDSEEDEDEDSSLVSRPRARRHIIYEDEAEVSPARPVLDEPPLSSSVPVPSIPPLATSASLPTLSALAPLPVSTAPASTPVIFTSSFAPPSIATPSSVQHTEEGSTSRSLAMRSVTLEVPANNSLLRKSGRADVWLEPLIGDIEKKKMNSHSCLTLMNDIVHSTLKANFIGTELMGRISLLEKKARESEKSILEAERIAKGAQLEAANWKEQFENTQGTIEELQESRDHLEQQKRALTSELAVAKASSSQFEKDKERLECSFSEQLSMLSEEIRELSALLSKKKKEYVGELVQSLTQAQADLRTSSDKVRALESSHASLRVSVDSTLAENEELKKELAVWEKDYETLEDKLDLEVSWAFLNSRRDALTEASQENFDLESELAKVLDAIEKTQQPLDFPSPAIETPVAEKPANEEATTEALEVENVAAQVPEGETFMTQSTEAEASVTLAALADPITSSQADTAHVASSEVDTMPMVVPENEANITTSDVTAPQ